MATVINPRDNAANTQTERNTNNELLTIKEFVVLSGATKFGITNNPNTQMTFAYITTPHGTLNMRCDQKIYTTKQGQILKVEDDSVVTINDLRVVVEDGALAYSEDDQGRLQINAGIALTNANNGVDLLALLA